MQTIEIGKKMPQLVTGAGGRNDGVIVSYRYLTTPPTILSIPDTVHHTGRDNEPHE